MIDWTSSMQQSFQYFKIHPITWKEMAKVDNIQSCSITWDAEKDTLGSASFEITGDMEECYIRPYLVVNQNGSEEKFSLGTFLVQPSSSNFDGVVRTRNADGYTPLIELKETYPDIGYTIHKDLNIMEQAYQLTKGNMRGPVVQPFCKEKLIDDFPAKSDETWCDFIVKLMGNASYSFSLDETSRVLFSPYQRTSTLMPVYTFNDDNSSILGKTISATDDMYGVPNMIEVIYSGSYGYYRAVEKNEDENSPISIQGRGRVIQSRITNPEITGTPSQPIIDQYCKKAIDDASTLQKEVTYSHGYVPTVRIKDCVRLNYRRAGIENVKAKVIRQTLNCTTGIEVQETAVFTDSLYGNTLI